MKSSKMSLEILPTRLLGPDDGHAKWVAISRDFGKKVVNIAVGVVLQHPDFLEDDTFVLFQYRQGQKVNSGKYRPEDRRPWAAHSLRTFA
ncbi:MAG: hypothetical protein MZV70_73625 [Desulfobacterales bacterium]|nr:hypothetical protein [Desulfobacterales bacterium]